MKPLTTLILTLLVSGGLWADMDKICNLNLLGLNDDIGFLLNEDREYIGSNCDRNNILQVSGVHEGAKSLVINEFCRFDRNVHEHKHISGNSWTISCVLYNNEPRRYLNR
jgi:hypothetical protein